MGGGTSGQICSPIIPDSSDTLGFVRQSERGVVEAIRSANLTSFAAALAAPALKDVHTSPSSSYSARARKPHTNTASARSLSLIRVCV